jgi:histidine triad (HIT) family protein
VRGYLCLWSKRHVTEPFELARGEQIGFLQEAMAVAEALRSEFQPIKVNYEIHGNTLPHLHLHLFPRYPDDHFVGRPINGGEIHYHHDEAELARLRRVARSATTAGFGVERADLVVPERVPCPYCENLEGRYAWHGPPARVADDELTYSFLAPAPLGGMPGHILVIPKRHVETIFELSFEEESALAHAVARGARVLRAALAPEGVLIQQHSGIAAFQTVPHAHFHVIPKRPGPFPPLEQPAIVPVEERVQLADRLAALWDQ